MAEHQDAPPSGTVRVAQAVIGGVLGVIGSTFWCLASSQHVDWLVVAVAALAIGGLFYFVGQWILWTIGEWFRWF